MCLTTRRAIVTAMDENIERLREAAYYIPGEYLNDCSTGMAYVYSQGLISGREQALRILGGGPSQP
jgi:hypothetical protein